MPVNLVLKRASLSKTIFLTKYPQTIVATNPKDSLKTNFLPIKGFCTNLNKESF